MEQYSVTGMSCAACSARVEKAVSKVKGVTSCSVSLLTNSMGVEGTASSEEIVKAVVDAGYGASPLSDKTLENKSSNGSIKEKEELLYKSETPVLVKRLVTSLVFLLVLMYFSMGHMMWNWPLPSWFSGNHVAMALVQMILAAIVMMINKKFFVSGFKSLVHRTPNMDTLVALGSGVSFVYSVVMTFAMTDAVIKNNEQLVMHYMDNLYFEGAAMIVTLITIGKLLESISKGRTTDALKSLMKLSPQSAVIVVDGKEVKVAIEQVKSGDIFVVRPGENIPVDGVVVEGTSAINEAALTGESIPVDKKSGDSVFAATTNVNGFIKCRAVHVGEDTTLSKIIQLVSDAAATKAPVARIADKVSGIFVPSVMAIALVTFVVWILCHAEFSFALTRAIAVLVISCPCALGLATPVAIMVGNGMGAKHGILFKTSASLEECGRTQIVALDKTGTITQGKPQVRNIVSCETVSCETVSSEEELVRLAYSAEKLSEHPLAKAVVEYYEKLCAEKNQQPVSLSVENFKSYSGNGIEADVDGKKLIAGNLKFIREKVSVDDKYIKTADEFSLKGKTPLCFSYDGKFIGIIAVADVIKEDSAEAIKELKMLGIYTVMLTGDNPKTAAEIGRIAGVDKVVAGVLPDGKEKVIRQLQKIGKVCMVGDGINDAPSLTAADVGIAIGAGADVALDAADIVVVKSKLTDVAKAIRLSRATLRNIYENLFWAFFYNIIGIPLAAGAYYHAFGWELNPMFGAAAMSLSSFCVVTNALRLNLFNINSCNKFRRKCNINFVQEAGEMAEVSEKVFKVEGMMCCNCERHVKEALSAIDGVTEAAADHEKGTATVKLSKEVEDTVLSAAIEKEGYKCLGRA